MKALSLLDVVSSALPTLPIQGSCLVVHCGHGLGSLAIVGAAACMVGGTAEVVAGAVSSCAVGATTAQLVAGAGCVVGATTGVGAGGVGATTGAAASAIYWCCAGRGCCIRWGRDRSCCQGWCWLHC